MSKRILLLCTAAFFQFKLISFLEHENARRFTYDNTAPLTVPNNHYLTSLNLDFDGEDYEENSCAILFFGLPRSFKLFVLPSIIENIFIPNLENKCDYYLHYFAIKSEEGNRNGEAGGQIKGRDVFLLEDALRETYKRFGKSKGKIPSIYITNSTMEEFQFYRHNVMTRYERSLDETGEYLYFPYNADWEYPQTMRNMVKQWHSIDAVWESMVHTRKIQNQKKYSRVAMLRNDVMYVTPFDIYKLPNNERDVDNNHFVIPDWANYPVNDRMVAGPYNAIKVWATQRFARIDQHVRTYPSKGWGMHSERYMNFTIFPAMKKRGNYTMAPDPNLCFLRARVDGSVWIQDCKESIQEDLGPKVMDLLEKYHSFGKEENDGGITCTRKSITGIKKDVISCHGDPDMAVWNKE